MESRTGRLLLAISLAVICCWGFEVPPAEAGGCPKASRKALAAARDGDLATTLRILSEADRKKGGDALRCLFRWSQQHPATTTDTYRLLSRALLDASQDSSTLDTTLVPHYLDGAELAARRSFEPSDRSAAGFAGKTMLVQVLVAKMETSHAPHLAWEIVRLARELLDYSTDQSLLQWAGAIVDELEPMIDAQDAGWKARLVDLDYRDEAVTKADKLSSRQAQYTPEARTAGIQGYVTAQAVIDTDGRLSNIRILKGLPMGLTTSALRALETWRYKPAAYNLQPVPTTCGLTINFRLN